MVLYIFYCGHEIRSQRFVTYEYEYKKLHEIFIYYCGAVMKFFIGYI